MELQPAGRPSVPLLVVVLTVLCDLALALLFVFKTPVMLASVALDPPCAPPDAYASIGYAIGALHLLTAVGVVVSRKWGAYPQIVACAVDALFPWWREPHIDVLILFSVLWTIPALLLGAYWLRFPKRVTRTGAAAYGTLALMFSASQLAPTRARNLGGWPATTIGHLRAFVAAEKEYAKANGGFYGSPLCLTQPKRCLPESDGSPPKPFVGPREPWSCAGVPHHYQYAFHPGREAGESPMPGARLASFACTASPVQVTLHGRPWRVCRAFCIDSTGSLCETEAGAEPTVIDGRCDLSTCKQIAPTVGLGAGEVRMSGPKWSSSALSDLRALVRAENAYSRASGGFYASPQCLAEPQKCPPPSMSSSRRPFLHWADAVRYSTVQSDYRLTFHPGRTADDESAPGSRLVSFACIAVPIAPEYRDGPDSNGFCVDSTGVVCATAPGGEPKVIDGRCDQSTCRKLQ